MDCILKCPGGTGMGQPRHDTAKPLYEYLVDNDYFYRLVLNHLKTCKLCSPEEVLQVYLNRRRRIPKFQGFVSEGLIKLAGKFAKLYTSQKLQVPDSILKIQREMRWRAYNYQTLLRYEHEFTFEEFYQSARLIHTYESPGARRNYVRERLVKYSNLLKYVML